MLLNPLKKINGINITKRSIKPLNSNVNLFERMLSIELENKNKVKLGGLNESKNN